MDDKMKELWPTTCPECGSPAWIGLNDVKCVSRSCRNGSATETRKYAEMVLAQEEENEEEPDERTPLLGFPSFDDLCGSKLEERRAWPKAGSDDWMERLEKEIEEALAPIGTVKVRRDAMSDTLTIQLHNPVTGLYISESFDAEYLCAYDDEFTHNHLVNRCIDTFPRCLIQTHLFERHRPLIESAISRGASPQGEYYITPKHTRYLHIGQSINGKVVSAISRTRGTFKLVER